ncbi:MAG: proteasome-associated ATPase, partial [Verrucomicrobiota bacterium]
MSDERSEGLQGGDENARPRGLLESFDLLIASLPPGDPMRRQLLNLRPDISDQEDMIGEARHMIEKLEEVIKKVTSPANRIGTFLGATSRDTAHIVVGGADYYCNIDPRIPLAKLKKGTRVLVNEAFVIVGDLGFEMAGPVTKITEVIGEDRLRVGSDHGTQSMVLERSSDLAKSTLKSGDEVRVDPNYRMALEMLSSAKSHEHYLDVVPELGWEKVGGQEQALQA